MKRAVVVGLIGAALGVAYVSNALAEKDWNPTTLIRFGQAEQSWVEYARTWFGQNVVFHASSGHAGKFFFMQAMDPLYLEPDAHAAYLDRPAYRAQRMAYPTLASMGGLLGPTATAWGLIVVNIIAMGFGTFAIAKLAQDLGASPWFGLAFTFNPGMLHELFIDGSGVLATAALFAGILLTRQHRWWAAGLMLAASVLSRETIILAVLGLLLYEWRRHRRVRWQLLMPSVVAASGWWIYLRIRVPDEVTQDLQAVDFPLAGFARAMSGWLNDVGKELDIAVAILILALSVYVIYRAIKTPTLLNHAAAGVALITFVMSDPVWAYLDATRALAPMLTAFVLMVFAKEEREVRLLRSPKAPAPVG